MKKLSQSSKAKAFTLLEVIIVLAITALVLGAVYSLAQGTLLLADDVRRAERRDARMQAFTTFCERLLAELPANALLTLTTTEEHGQYLTRLELENVPSPFDGTPGCLVKLYTETMVGGGVSLNLSCSKQPDKKHSIVVTVFERLRECEWRVFDASTCQWASEWTEQRPKITLPQQEAPTANIRQPHPFMLEINLTSGADSPLHSVFWIHASTPATP